MCYIIVILGGKFEIFSLGSVTRYGQNKTIMYLYGTHQGTCSNGASGNYMDAIFELVVHEETEAKDQREAYYSSQVSRVCVVSV